MEDLNRNRPTPEQVPLEDIEINDEYFAEPTEESKPPEKTGFSETLVKPVKSKEIPKLDIKVCENTFINGSKVNKKFYCPSQFPKLTRIKSITVSNKKGGKRKTRKISKEI